MVAGLTLVSLPLCCLPTLAAAPNPLFRGEYTIANDSGETLYVTPVGSAHGRRWILAKIWSRFPYVPLLKQADIRLEPGESIHIVCTIDKDDAFSEIAVRNLRGKYRQLGVGQPTLKLMPQVGASRGAGPTYTISRFTALDVVSPDVLRLHARRGGPARCSCRSSFRPCFSRLGVCCCGTPAASVADTSHDYPGMEMGGMIDGVSLPI